MTQKSALGNSSLIRVGIVGYGYWGPNLARNFADCPDFQLAAIADMRPERLAIAARRYPSIQTATDFESLLRNPHLDAIAIATPVSTHFDLAMRALQAGKHVFLEKPLTETSEQALQLIEEAERQKRVLMVDHTFVYTGAVRKVGDLIRSGELGDLYYYDSVRVNLGLFQHDVNVVWDLSVHDVSIMDAILPETPVAVSATGKSHVPGRPENIAFVTLFFASNMIAHMHVNWLSPVKVRKTLIGGSKKMVVLDELESVEKVKVYECGVTVSTSQDSTYQTLIDYRTGDMWSPRIDVSEALAVEIRHFAKCILGHEKPRTDGHCGLRVVRVLEAASQSMRCGGRPVELAESMIAMNTRALKQMSALNQHQGGEVVSSHGIR